ncbi:MAG: tRNA (adenosine(37)-N6)-threonylcarbamoyltransferase complex dimerization subunit type 1 TsaB [Rubrobacteraceae bacterium]|nr:tRNA (adenosine(37)-N6)-threonylcarbamoyltransferase complex dimerization subunit type 1 TsaB [Rubrobacteraceae bacterium]
MLTLALDASTAEVSVALARLEGHDREVLAEVSCSARGASETLLPSVHEVLELAGEDLGDVGRIVVGVGPGTFTGIRIAVATARALAGTLGAEICASSTLDALAHPALSSGRERVVAVIDARRRQVFAELFAAGVESTGVLCVRPGELSRHLPREGDLLLVGDGAVRYREELSSLGHIPEDSSPLNRVSAAGYLVAGDLEPVPPEKVVPLYVREPDAEVRRERNPWSRP